MNRNEKTQRGFTLLELMVVIGILTLLALVGISGYAHTSGWLARLHLKSAARDMVMNFQYARMEAIKRNTFCAVVFTTSADSFSYVIFADNDRNMTHESGTDSDPLKTIQSVNYKDVTLDTSKGGGTGLTFGVNSDSSKATLAFDPRGLPRTGSAANFGGGTLFLKDAYGNTLSIVVNNIGHIGIQ